MAARAAADANTQAQRTQRVLAEALQERESARLERAQAVQERGRALADASLGYVSSPIEPGSEKFTLRGPGR